MKSLRKGALACVVALSQLFLNPGAIASGTTYQSSNEVQFSEAELAQILAPIALYPDTLLTHIVIASTYPLEVVEAHRWLQQNAGLEASVAVNLAENEGWDPSISALVAFPSVLERLSQDLQWTQNLGNAFLEDEGRVLDSIQALRQQADEANSLAQMHNMKVSRVNKIIVIEPARKEIVYVPYYNTSVVYGNWRWNRYPPVHWGYQSQVSIHSPNRISGIFGWNGGISIGFNYHFSAFSWGNRHVVVTNHRKTRQYRSHQKITSSYGAQRWQHKPSHRRNVAYRTQDTRSRYSNQKQNKLYSQQARKSEPRNVKTNISSRANNAKRYAGTISKKLAFARKQSGSSVMRSNNFANKSKNQSRQSSNQGNSERFVSNNRNVTNKPATQRRAQVQKNQRFEQPQSVQRQSKTSLRSEIKRSAQTPQNKKVRAVKQVKPRSKRKDR